MAENIKQSHPKGLYFVFATGMSERFSYYGMRAIFVLYLIKALLMDKEFASAIYGNYTGLVYLTPLVGGYVADRYLGMRRSIFWGAEREVSPVQLYDTQSRHTGRYIRRGIIPDHERCG